MTSSCPSIATYMLKIPIYGPGLSLQLQFWISNCLFDVWIHVEVSQVSWSNLSKKNPKNKKPIKTDYLPTTCSFFSVPCLKNSTPHSSCFLNQIPRSHLWHILLTSSMTYLINHHVLQILSLQHPCNLSAFFFHHLPHQTSIIPLRKISATS